MCIPIHKSHVYAEVLCIENINSLFDKLDVFPAILQFYSTCYTSIASSMSIFISIQV